MVGRKMLVMIISYTGTPCSASPLPQPGIQRQGTSLPETPDGKDHPVQAGATLGHSQLRGLPGVLGLGGVSAASPSTWHPNISSSSLASGGGMGYLPTAISTRESPMLQMSDCTE